MHCATRQYHCTKDGALALHPDLCDPAYVLKTEADRWDATPQTPCGRDEAQHLCQIGLHWG